MLKIVTVPNIILTTPVKPVISFDGSLQNLIGEMAVTLKAQVDPQGVGLAATQVAKNISVFIMKPKPKSPIKIFINPKILECVNLQIRNKIIKNKSHKKNRTPLEGCLSIPRIWSPIKRPKKLLLQYQTETGEQKTEWFKDFEAVIIQHEVDHLNGILFTQRALEQNSTLFEEKNGKLKKMEY